MKRIGNVQKLYKISAYVKFATVPLAEATHGKSQSQWGKGMPTHVDAWRCEKLGMYMKSAFHTWQECKFSIWIIDTT